MEFLIGSTREGKSRKFFLLAGISLAAVGTFFFGLRKPEKIATVKFLTQEGKLVKMDANKLPIGKRMASKAEIQNWIKK